METSEMRELHINVKSSRKFGKDAASTIHMLKQPYEDMEHFSDSSMSVECDLCVN